MGMMASEPVRTRFILLNRGPADWSRAEDGDPPVVDDGTMDLELAGRMLPQFDVIIASAQRASQETAEAILGRRPVSMILREELDEIRTAARLESVDDYHEWLDRLFESYSTSQDGESLAEGVERIIAGLRAAANQYYGRSMLVISHPVILLALRAHLLMAAVSRDQVDGLPNLAVCIIDYLEGRFYLVEDFPTRWAE